MCDIYTFIDIFWWHLYTFMFWWHLGIQRGFGFLLYRSSYKHSFIRRSFPQRPYNIIIMPYQWMLQCLCKVSYQTIREMHIWTKNVSMWKVTGESVDLLLFCNYSVYSKLLLERVKFVCWTLNRVLCTVSEDLALCLYRVYSVEGERKETLFVLLCKNCHRNLKHRVTVHSVE